MFNKLFKVKIILIMILFISVWNTAYAYRPAHCSECGGQYGESTTHAATCTSKGYIVWNCNICGSEYRETLPALGHSWGNWYTGRSPTCTKPGYDYRTCSRCSETDYRTTSAYGHSWSNWALVNDATCTEDGHERRECRNCGAEETRTTPKLGHIPGNWETVTYPTCTTTGTEVQRCQRYIVQAVGYCGAIVATRSIDALGHTWGPWEVTQQATCTQAGTETSICGRDSSHVQTRSLAALGHNMGEWVRTTEPTCLNKGQDTKYCSRCSYTETQDVPALGHSWGPWYVSKYETCTEKGENRRDCIRIAQCVVGFEVTERPALGHSLGNWYVVRPPTCTEDGLERRECQRSVCPRTGNGWYEERAITKLGHDYKVTTIPPTCTEGGYDRHVCARCGHIYTDNPTNPLGHDFGEWRIAVAPTCTQDGTEIRECRRCGFTETRPVEKLGHSYGDWVVTIEPKCTTEGQRTKTCVRCGDVISEVIASLGHLVDPNWSKNESTHWKICVRPGCGVTVVPNEAHMDTDEDGKCDVCEYPMIVLLGKPSVVGTYTYNHNPQTATLSGFDPARMSVTGNVQTDAGTYTITVTINNTRKYHWTDDTTGPVYLTWIINPERIDYPGKTDHVYNGATQVGVVSGHGYTVGGDYQGIDAQTYTATVETDSNHVFQDGRTKGNVTWVITPKPVEVVWDTTRSFVYDRNPHTVSATCPTGVTGETINLDITSNIPVGTYTAIATPTGVTGGREKLSNYEISNLTCEYQITAKSINDPSFVITVEPDTFEYDGSKHEPNVTVKDGSYTLQNDEYSVRFENNKDAGNNTAQVIVTGEKNYKDSKTATFSITARPLYVFGVSTEKMTLVNDPVFEYTYSNNVNAEVPGFEGALSREAGEAEGSYRITVGTLHLVDNSGGNFKASNYYMVYNPDGVEPIPPGDKDPTLTVSNFEGMVFTVKVPANGTLKLPIPEVGGNIYKVSWGDGAYNEYDSVAFPSHTYETANTYTVIVAGNISIFGPCMAEEITATNTYKDFYSFKTYLTQIVDFGNIHANRLGFSQCTNLVGPLPTRSGFDNIEYIENMFNGCTGLNIQIPAGFFKDLNKVISAKNVFKGCTGLTGQIPGNLFEGCTSLRSFESTFEGCNNLTGVIPVEIFNDCTKVENFIKTFKGCGKVTTIPEELFAKQKEVLSFYETFSECTGITGIPENMFLQNVKATNYYRTFYNTRIAEVPEHLFANNIIRRISNNAGSFDDYRGTFEKCTSLTALRLDVYFIGMEMFKDCTGIKEITLPSTVEIGKYAYHNDNQLITIRVGRDYLSKINQYAFLYTGANPPLLTYVNRNNEVLVKYNWAENNRKIDVEAPKGYVEIVADRYPYTKTENVKLKITATDDVSPASEIKIAILNDKMYTPPTQEEIEATGLEDLFDPDNLTVFNWEPYVENKDWVLNDVEGVKTVYVYFRDEMNNISNVSLDI